MKVLKKRYVNLYGCIVVPVLYAFNKKMTFNNLPESILFFFKNYFNDLICPIFFLAICEIILLCIGYEIQSYAKLLLIGLSAGAFWEYVSPIFKSTAVSDTKDLLCYLCGTTFYYLMLKYEIQKAV